MKEKKHFPLSNDVLQPMNSFYIAPFDRWLDLYWNINQVPGVEMTLYWNDDNNNYQHNMCFGEVLNCLEHFLNPEGE